MLIDYRIRVHGVPIRWRTEITARYPPHRFIDVQLRGPYTLWHHKHTLEERDGGTLCLNHVRYRPRGGRSSTGCSSGAMWSGSSSIGSDGCWSFLVPGRTKRFSQPATDN
jgi:ligand-binding SRPBCC domain-containing protein